jgi:photosystem II stability/assembly factor-like uncharacterized protein
MSTMRPLHRNLLAAALALAATAPLSAGWSPVGGPVPPVVTLQLDPSRPEILYARSVSEGVPFRGFYLWRSEDAGATWRDVEPGLEVPLNALGIDPENPRVIWAWAPEGTLWRSADAGDTWALRATFPSPIALQVVQILVDPHDPNTLYRVEIDLASSKPVVSVSRDGGTTFRKGALLPDATTYARLVLTHPARDELLAFTSKGLLASDDGGQSWRFRGQLPHGQLGRGLRAPSAPDTLYAVPLGNNNHCAARSDDDGAHWRLLSYPPRLPSAHTFCYDVAVDPQDALHVWVTARISLPGHFQYRLVESRNGGTTWSKPVAVPDPFVIAAGGERLYTGDDEGLRLYTSADGGRTWTPTDHGIIAGDLRDGLVAQRPPGGGPRRSLLALNTPLSGTPDELYRSDGGQIWMKVTLAPGEPVTIAGVGGSIVLSGDDNGVLRSTDNGMTWTVLPASPQGVQAFRSDPVQPQYPALLAFQPNDAYGNLALWTSNDAGATWRRSSDGLPTPCSHIASVDVCPAFPAYAVDPFNPSRRWISNYEAYPLSPRIFATEDAGATWHLATADLPLTLALAADPQAPDRLLAGTYGGLFVSTDGGPHWAPLGDLPDGAVIHQFAWDPLSASWYAATIDRGIYRSLDGGAHWTLLAGAPDHDKPTIAVDPRRPTALLAAFAGQGLWRWTP